MLGPEHAGAVRPAELHRAGGEVGRRQPQRESFGSIGHHAEWIKACKEGTPTTCNFDYSGALSEAVLLGNVAFRTGEALEWDAKTLTATNCAAADKYIRKQYRKGWEVA